MEFTCAHCEKPIRCSAILVDGEFLHSSCETSFIELKDFTLADKEWIDKIDGSELRIEDIV